MSTSVLSESKPEMSQFEREYFIQTRKEIDSEKHERNTILNYAVIATGALSVIMGRSAESGQFFQSSDALFIYIPLLLLISALFSARRTKLRQIGDRWFALYDLLDVEGMLGKWTPLERVVCEGIARKRYLSEDLLQHLALSSVVYSLTGAVAWHAWRSDNLGVCIFGSTVVVVHFGVTTWWLSRRLPLSQHYLKHLSALTASREEPAVQAGLRGDTKKAP